MPGAWHQQKLFGSIQCLEHTARVLRWRLCIPLSVDQQHGDANAARGCFGTDGSYGEAAALAGHRERLTDHSLREQPWRALASDALEIGKDLRRNDARDS